MIMRLGSGMVGKAGDTAPQVLGTPSQGPGREASVAIVPRGALLEVGLMSRANGHMEATGDAWAQSCVTSLHCERDQRVLTTCTSARLRATCTSQSAGRSRRNDETMGTPGKLASYLRPSRTVAHRLP